MISNRISRMAVAVLLPVLAITFGLQAAYSPALAETKPVPAATRLPAPERLVAIGDLHGRLDQARNALKKAGAINDKDEWIGGKLVVVITGDFTDRGDDELAIVDLFDKLQPEAKKAGGALHVMNGNHEVMNATLQFWAVTPKGYSTFKERYDGKVELTHPDVKSRPPVQRWRAAAFMPGGPLAVKLANYPFVLIVGDTVFVHGGLHPDHVRYGVDRINREMADWLSGKTDSVATELTDRSSPIWLRAFAKAPDAGDCKLLAETLDLLKVKRMVVGHTIHDHISTSCEEGIWKIDTGMNPAYFGGPVEVLEIVGNKLNVIR